jgi:hypothetical protein
VVLLDSSSLPLLQFGYYALHFPSVKFVLLLHVIKILKGLLLLLHNALLHSSLGSCYLKLLLLSADMHCELLITWLSDDSLLFLPPAFFSCYLKLLLLNAEGFISSA